MYTEILKIIEGGLNQDSQKVSSYAKLLAENLRNDGDEKMYDRILKILKNQKSSLVFQDQFIVTPVDQESRMNMADIILPDDKDDNLIFSSSLKETLNNFIDMQKYRADIQKHGVEVNSSLLLFGPPGCGKTTIARYIAKSLNLPLVVIRFDSLISSLLGNTAKNIRKVFEFANNKPCILFLDEFDAIAKARDDQHEMGELKRVINSLLQNIDDFIKDNILIAATNHHELLDKAIWRRFNSIIEVNKPEIEEVCNLIGNLFNSIDNDFVSSKKLESVSKAFVGLSHADIKTIANNAISKTIISKKMSVNTEEVLSQLFSFKNNNKYDLDESINFLHKHGVSQASLSDFYSISSRQIANKLKKK